MKMSRHYNINLLFSLILIVAALTKAEISLTTVDVTTLPSAFQERTSSACYNELGCISLNSSWFHVVHRPVNVLPLPRDRINTHFMLHTRDKPSGVKIFPNDYTGIISASYKASRQTKFYIHGFHATGYEDQVQSLVAALLSNGDFNVIVVHWGDGASTNYVQATANTRLVALEVVYLINVLMEKFSLKITDTHVIGHSLGAHIAGYIGENIQKLGRITGLDPAGPFFRGMPSFVSLDPSDAQFVEAVHTDGNTLGYGMSETVGHLDFYPNGGEHQPGCEPVKFSLVLNISSIQSTDLASCSHSRAVRLYADSIKVRADCQIIAYGCLDYDSFNKGRCITCGEDNSRCAPFGLQQISYQYQSRRNVKLYFRTEASAPYCSLHYAVTLHLAKPQNARDVINGKLMLSISGDKGLISNVKLTQSDRGEKLEHGHSQHYLFTTSTYLGSVKKINLRWEYVTNGLDASAICGLFKVCSKKLYVKSVYVSPLNLYPEATRVANTFGSCPPSSPIAIDTGSSFDFDADNSCA